MSRPAGIVEAQPGQLVGEGEDGASDGEIVVGRVNVIRGGGEEISRARELQPVTVTVTVTVTLHGHAHGFTVHVSR